jgi:hypothetical protein
MKERMPASVKAPTMVRPDSRIEIGAPVASGATTTTTAAAACSGPPPAQLAIPSGFGTGRAGPAAGSDTPPASTQQVTTWTSDRATIEQRWPSDANRRPWDQSSLAPDGPSGIAEDVVVDAGGGAHRTLLFGFANQAKGCETLQVTVYGADADTVRSVSDGLVHSPFVSPEPLVTTSRAAAAIPGVVACEAEATASSGVDTTTSKATVDGAVTGTGAAFGRPEDALAAFLVGEPQLFQHGYDELQLADGSVAYVKQVRPGVVVTAVHVTADAIGWSARDWRASGC